MTRYFTHYWTKDSLSNSRQTHINILTYAASSQFEQRGIASGDVIYPVSYRDGQMLVVGKFEVAKVCNRTEAAHYLGTSDLFDSEDYALAREPATVDYDGVVVPIDVAKRLRFVKGKETTQLVFVSNNELDRQTLRNVRELAPSSASLLDNILDRNTYGLAPVVSSSSPAKAALQRYRDYTREEVHNIFDPHSRFQKSVGRWGLQGIIPVADCPGDFVFFVTYGRIEGDHAFDEGITTEGVLSWQSQPRQTLVSEQVQQLISHDYLKNNIYLMLRTKAGLPYTYLGKLQYLTHDKDREKPVHFQWQILDWDEAAAKLKEIDIDLVTDPENKTESPAGKDQLIEQLPPSPKAQTSDTLGKSTKAFRSSKTPDYSAIDAKNRALGLAGEKLVVKAERERLLRAGYPELASKVRHVSVEIGDGLGYDVRSFSSTGESKFIEVKTTRKSADTAFFMSSSEVEFSQENADNYSIHRVYNYDKETNSGEYFVIEGDVMESFDLTPTSYKLTVKDK